MIRGLGMIVATSTALASPAPAQLMGATELKVAVPVKGAASTKPVAALFYLVGETGAKETYTLTGKGPASLTLFGPDGSEILTASGTGTVKLEAVLPFTDVFTLAVARVDSGPPYVLSRETTVPTLTQAVIAENVGYRSPDTATRSCWLVPGSKKLMIFDNGTMIEFALSDDRNASAYSARLANGYTYQGVYTYRMNGDALHITDTSNGASNETDYEFDLTQNLAPTPQFTGYLCNE